MLNVILIDDEVDDINSLSEKLASCGDDINISAKCRNIPEAVKAIHAHQPDIVFSDIEMPGYSGLQLLDFFNDNEVGFELIFTTSYSDFAVRAFQLSAIDYLLKPVDVALLKKAVDKVRKKQNFKLRERAELLRDNLASQMLKRIALPYNGGVNFIDTTEIVYLKADNVYTDIFLRNKSTITASKPLKDFATLLPKTQFFRCHRSYLINMQLVKEYITTNGGEIVMANGVLIPVARERKEDFISLWKQLIL
jgi:two-component system LytT family response regulator